MSITLPLETYKALERNLGQDDAAIVLKTFETAISANIEYSWVTTKDDLLSEMKEEFASKADLELVRGEIQLVRTVLIGEINKVDAKIDNVKVELNSKIDKVHTELSGKIDNVKVELIGEISKVDGKIDKVKAELIGEINKVDAKIDKVKAELIGEINKVDAKIDKVHTELNGKIDHLETRLSAQSKLHFVVLLLVIFFTNDKAIDLIAKLLGIVK